jgi:hypothetical protein
MCQALLLPIYGPLLNYDYAAGQPGHDHLYIGQVDLFHHADDSNGTITVAVDEHGCPRRFGVVVNVPSQNASDSAWSASLLPADTAALLSANHCPDLAYSFQAHYLARQGIFIAPPEKPPRV